MKKIILMIYLLISCVSVYSNNDSLKLKIYFRQSVDSIDMSYRENGKRVAQFKTQLNDFERDSSLELDTIKIISYASPEGTIEFNEQLCKRRAESLLSLVYESEAVKIITMSENWNLSESYAFDYIKVDKKVIDGLLTTEMTLFCKKDFMKRCHYSVWKMLISDVFPDLRYAEMTLIYSRKQCVIKNEIQPLQIDSVKYIEPDITHLFIVEQHKEERKPLFAVRSNVLMDLITNVNIGIEFPFAKHYSVSCDWYFPWWHSMSRHKTFELMYGELALKYWLRKHKQTPNGMYFGIVYGYGIYDFQLFSDRGYQGNLMNIGATIGYSHKLYKNLYMSYYMNVGYTKSSYKKYFQVDDTREFGDIKVWEKPWIEKKFSGFVPQNISVSLMYYFDKKSKRKR